MKNTELFIFEMANNHQGSVEHGKQIIAAVRDLVGKYKIRAAVKFQLRNLDTFIHPDFRTDKTNKMIRRFLDTELPLAQFQELVDFTKENKLLTMATVFDEDSISAFHELEIDILKIASCSALDFPLLKALRKIKAPTIISTAGLNFEQIDLSLAHLARDPKEVTIMHCVGLYPTKNNELMLDRISDLKKHYPKHQIGYSTHEHPESTIAVQLAHAKGVSVFEKHIAVETEEFPKNAYSANPQQCALWIEAFLEAKKICLYDANHAQDVHAKEWVHLNDLKRAAYAKEAIEAKTEFGADQTRFAIPIQGNQLTASDFQYKKFKAKHNIQGSQALEKEQIDSQYCDQEYEELLNSYSQICLRSNLHLKEGQEAEISAHYGLGNINQAGALLLTLVNKIICKKYIILLPQQCHPQHRHLDKAEHMCLLAGDAQILIDNQESQLSTEFFTEIKAKNWHSFKSERGAIIEELSTEYAKGQSEYQDPTISCFKAKLVWSKQRWTWL